MRKKFLPVIVLFSLLLSCTKAIEEKSCLLNSATIAGAYKFTAIVYKKDSSTPAIDQFAILPSCEKDDILTINADNTYAYTDAGATCTPAGDESGTWILSGSRFTLGGDIYTVSYFDCGTITGSYAGSTEGELTTITLVRK
ncbi:MAG: lipocalin family protein [Ferruginibacter sp.]|nr:lipocalin family protein [Ferruginibacter sp.]